MPVPVVDGSGSSVGTGRGQTTVQFGAMSRGDLQIACPVPSAPQSQMQAARACKAPKVSAARTTTAHKGEGFVCDPPLCTWEDPQNGAPVLRVPLHELELRSAFRNSGNPRDRRGSKIFMPLLLSPRLRQTRQPRNNPGATRTCRVTRGGERSLQKTSNLEVNRATHCCHLLCTAAFRGDLRVPQTLLAGSSQREGFEFIDGRKPMGRMTAIARVRSKKAARQGRLARCSYAGHSRACSNWIIDTAGGKESGRIGLSSAESVSST